MDLYLATTNQGKVNDFQRLFAAANLPHIRVLNATVLGGMPHVEETANTFEGNALLKVRALAKIAPKEACVIGEDSGLCIDALSGAPGLYSARYSGENATDQDNIEKVLSQMESVKQEDRGAKFICSMVLHHPSNGEIVFQGTVKGYICQEQRGNEGFGYNPIFVPNGFELTFAQMTPDQKNAISHRGLAFRELAQWLKQFS